MAQRLPKKFWTAFYSPLPRKFLREACLFDLLRGARKLPIPDTFWITPCIQRKSFTLVYPLKTITQQTRVLHDVTLLADGTIISDGKILPQSSLHSELSLAGYLTKSRSYYSQKRRPRLPEALFIPRIINAHGTYGDYFAEFLIPFVSHRVDPGVPILTDADFIERHAHADLDRIGRYDIRRLPESGLQVERLTVKLPLQFFDNFIPENIADLNRALPVESSDQLPSRVYISRLGYLSDRIVGSQCSLANEAHVESFLEGKGFFVVRPHEMDNSRCRATIQSARTIVFTHGSGFVNAAWARARSVVEIATPDRWNPFFLKLCVAMGVERYALLEADAAGLHLPTLLEKIHHVEQG